MRLIELTANQETFRPVTFNETGLTLVVGKKSDPTDTSREHSTNGVGKSLLLYLVSFCLGSNSNKQMKDKLPHWEFTLCFDLAGKRRVITRSTDGQKPLLLDGNEISLTDYRTLLAREAFGIEPAAKHLTFRALIGTFLRVGKPSYMFFD